MQISSVALIALEEFCIFVEKLQKLIAFDGGIEDAPDDGIVKDGLDDWAFLALLY